MGPLRHAECAALIATGKGVRDGRGELLQNWAGGEWPRGVLKRQMKVAFLALTDGGRAGTREPTTCAGESQELK